MPQSSMRDERSPARPQNAFDAPDGYSGQEYDITRERAEGEKLPSGTVDPKAVGKMKQRQKDEIADEQGLRATFDPDTGKVHGSGAGDAAGDGRTQKSTDT